MDAFASKERPGFWRELGRIASPLGMALALAMVSTPTASAQYYITVSASVALGDDGTIYATGITDAPGMQEHGADVTTAIRSPAARSAVAADYQLTGGYARAEASLPFLESDMGDYTASADGHGSCPVYGSLGSAFASLNFKVGISYICWVNPVDVGGGWARYSLYNPCNVQCPAQGTSKEIYTAGPPHPAGEVYTRDWIQLPSGSVYCQPIPPNTWPAAGGCNCFDISYP